MSDKEAESLAQLLFAIHDEALGNPYRLSWDSDILLSNHREAWIQVAQYIGAREFDLEERCQYGSLRGSSLADEFLKEHLKR